MESSIAHLEELLEEHLTDDEDDDDSFNEWVKSYTYDELPNPPPLKNNGWDDEFRGHILLQKNDPKLACLAVGEDHQYCPDIDNEEQWGALGTYLGNSEYLTELRLGYFGGVDKLPVIDMCTGLSRNRSITRLRIADKSFFEHSHFVHLVPFFQQNTNLRHLILEHDKENHGQPIELSKKGLLMLAVVLAKFNSLQTIELVDCKLMDDDCAAYIFDALRCHPGLVSVNLKGTKLGRKAKASLGKLNVEVDQSMPGAGGVNDLMGLLGSLGRSSDSPPNVPERVVPKYVQPGILCKVKGLQSAGGKKLNGRRCAVVRFVEEEGRYEVQMENEPLGDKTWALKEANLSILPKLVLPTHSSRGMASTAESLCELLLYYKGSGPYTDPEFSPSRITLRGLAASCLNQMKQSDLMWLVQVQMEQMAGVLALKSLCDDGKAESVLFALLNADPMIIDVLIQTIHWTGRIDDEDLERDEGFNGPPTELSPDQSAKPYVQFMSRGPLGLMVAMSQFKFSPALWAALERSEFYPFLIRRLLRLVAREALGTHDGTKLAPKARKILQNLLPGIDLQPLKRKQTAKNVLKRTLTDPGAEEAITAESMSALLAQCS